MSDVNSPRKGGMTECRGRKWHKRIMDVAEESIQFQDAIDKIKRAADDGLAEVRHLNNQNNKQGRRLKSRSREIAALRSLVGELVEVAERYKASLLPCDAFDYDDLIARAKEQIK